MSDEYPLMAFIANEGVTTKGERYDRSALVTDTVNKLYKKTEKGDFIYSSNNLETGSIGLNKYGKACISPVYSIFEPTGIADSDFLGRRLIRKDFINAMVKWRQGVIYGQWRIHESDFLKIEITVPSVEEQRKIGAYLDQLDNLITLHQKKCFECEKRRFSSASISWEQRKLGECFTERKDSMPEGELISVTIGEGIKKFSELGRHDNSNDDKSKYKKVCVGDIAYNSMRMWQGASGYSPYEGIVSPAYTVLSPITDVVDSKCISYLFKRSDMTHVFQMNSQGITSDNWNLKYPALSEIEIMVSPYLAEQHKIAAYLSRIDNLITLHQRKLELLKRLRNSLVDRCFIGEKCTMSKLILYHGSPNRVIVPKFGFGEDRHDYGRGFYLTENLELAKEWAVCRPDETNGWVHKYELEMEGLNILDFQKYDVLSWLAELMKHRDAADSRRYKMLAQKFIEKYGIDTCGYDVITGWRANASYFYIAKEFVRDNIDIEILEELLSLGGLGIQFCIKSERAFAQLSEVEQDIMSVDYSEFNDRYNSGTTICRAARS